MKKQFTDDKWIGICENARVEIIKEVIVSATIRNEYRAMVVRRTEYCDIPESPYGLKAMMLQGEGMLPCEGDPGSEACLALPYMKTGVPTLRHPD